MSRTSHQPQSRALKRSTMVCKMASQQGPPELFRFGFVHKWGMSQRKYFGTPLIFGYPSSPKQILPGLFSVFPAPFLEALDSSNEAVGLPAPWGASAPVSSIVQGHLAADSAVDANDMTEADPLIETHTTVVE